jgi:hypothetical protein
VRIRSVFNADTWRGFALELRPPGDYAQSRGLSWPLPEDLRDRVRLLWPRVYDWEHAGEWMDSLVDGFREHLDVEYTDAAQPYKHVVLATLSIDGSKRPIAIDYSDYLDVDEQCLADTDVYFKMQYAVSGYDSDRVQPGGFVARGQALYRYLPALRELRARTTARHDVHGAFSSTYAQDVRHRALEQLAEQKLFRFDGGTYLLRHSAYLQKIARSKVCIDLPGNGPLCFRLVEYLGVGSCIVGPPHAARLHVPLVDGEHIAYVNPDLSDLVATVAELVGQPDRRELLAANATEYFERYLHPRQLAAYYLHTALTRA